MDGTDPRAVLLRRAVHHLGLVLRHGLATEIAGLVLTRFADSMMATASEKTAAVQRSRWDRLVYAAKNAGRSGIGYGVMIAMTEPVLVGVLADLPR